MKQLKKTALIMLLAMVMILGLMSVTAAPVHAMSGELWIGGTEVSDSNLSGNGWSYDPSSKTLTLYGASISGTHPFFIEEYEYTAFIYSAGIDLTIELDGNNTLNSESDVDYGIYTNGNLTIKDTGKSGTLTVSTNEEYSSAIFTYGKDIMISGGTINASASGFTETSAVKTGNDEKKGNLYISGGTLDLTATGWESSTIDVRDLKISGGKVTASASGDDSFALEINANGTISGGEVTASSSGEDTETIFCDDSLKISGGTVKAAAEGRDSAGIFVFHGELEIMENARLVSSGADKAIACGYNGKVKNAVAGTGWTDAAGTKGMATIPVSKDGQTLSYKKVRFPELKLHDIKTVDGRYVQVLADKGAAYPEETVTVKAWSKGAYSPAVYVKKTSDGSIIQEVELTFNGQTFSGTFTMPDCDVTVEGVAKGAGDGGGSDAGSDIGSIYNINGGMYIVSAANTVSLRNAPNRKSFTIPAAVSFNGRDFYVAGIQPKAFKGTKIRTLTIKSKNLTKKSVKNSLKGSKIRTVRVKVGKKKENRKYVKKYRQFFTKKNAGRRVRVR